MTLEELLKRLNINVSVFDEWHSTQLKYKLQFEYEEELGNNTQWIVDKVISFDINTRTKTITLKGK